MGRTESIWDQLAPEVGKEKGDERKEARCLGHQIGSISNTRKTGVAFFLCEVPCRCQHFSH